MHAEFKKNKPGQLFVLLQLCWALCGLFEELVNAAVNPTIPP